MSPSLEGATGRKAIPLFLKKIPTPLCHPSPYLYSRGFSRDTQHHFAQLCLSSCSSPGQRSLCFSPYNPFVFQRSILPTLWTSSCLAPPPPHGGNSPTCSAALSGTSLATSLFCNSVEKRRYLSSLNNNNKTSACVTGLYLGCQPPNNDMELSY